MAEKIIRVGIIGAGRNTRDKHIPGLRAQKNVEVAAVANRTLDSAKRVADEMEIPHAAADWMEIIADKDIDSVCIGTWPYMHAPLTIAALEAGKHVLCEARMAMNLAEAREMLKVSRRYPALVAQIVPAPRTLGFDQTIVEMIGAAYIGDLISVDARMAPGSDFPAYGSPLHWRHDRDFSGNNIMSMGIWYESIMRWVGPMSTVHAVGQSVVSHRVDEAGRRVPMTIPDHIDVIGSMEQGGQMRFSLSSVAGHAQANAEIYIFGTEGTLCLREDNAGKMSLSGGKRGEDGLQEVKIDPAKRGAWRVEEEFINVIRGREPVTHTDFVTGVKYMEWTEAVTLSIRQGEAVKLPLLPV
jgi:predicted dehydrogenase